MKKLTQIAFDFGMDEPDSKRNEEMPASEEKKEADEDTIQVNEEPVVLPEIYATVKKEKEKKLRKSPRGRMRLSDMDAHNDKVDIPGDEELFSKRYYAIGTVAGMFGVNVSLIRFWENEFDILKPKKNGKGDRLFRPEDVKNLQMIYFLLREKKYTIEGAKDFIRKNKKAEEQYALIESLQKLKFFLLELKANI